MLYRRGAGIQQGLALMKKALELDPTYALAWAGIADTYSLLGYYGYLHPDEARAMGGEAVARALEYGPDLAEAHTARALQALLFEWDWPNAERSFKRALELNPGYSQASAWYNLFYRGFACGQWAGALADLKETYDRDPRSAYNAAIMAICHACFNSTDPAMEDWVERAEELDRDAFLTVWARQLAMNSLRDVKRGIEAGQRALEATGRHVFPLLHIGLLLAETGDLDGAMAVRDEVLSRSKREFMAPTSFALLEAALGNKASALEHCRQAIAIRDPQFVIFALGWPVTEALRALPEHRQMLREIRLPGVMGA
jgi:tetratricopeptide (TPR) repeat protein